MFRLKQLPPFTVYQTTDNKCRQTKHMYFEKKIFTLERHRRWIMANNSLPLTFIN